MIIFDKWMMNIVNDIFSLLSHVNATSNIGLIYALRLVVVIILIIFRSCSINNICHCRKVSHVHQILVKFILSYWFGHVSIPHCVAYLKLKLGVEILIKFMWLRLKVWPWKKAKNCLYQGHTKLSTLKEGLGRFIKKIKVSLF